MRNPPNWFNFISNSTQVLISDMYLSAVSSNASVQVKVRLIHAFKKCLLTVVALRTPMGGILIEVQISLFRTLSFITLMVRPILLSFLKIH